MKYKFLVILLLLAGLLTAQQSRVSINESWLFVKSPGNRVEIPSYEKAEQIHLPHSWNVQDVWDDVKGYYRDAAWYRKNLLIADSLKGRKVYLFFEGANQVAKVYVNGEKAGEHFGGYTAFRFEISKHVKYGTVNQIDVMVDNSFSREMAPVTGDFSMLGGIYRDVYLETSGMIHFELKNHAGQGVMLTSFLQEKNAGFDLKANIVNSSIVSRKVSIHTSITDAQGRVVLTQHTKPIQLLPSSTQNISQHIPVPDFQLWSPDNPHLYTIECKMLDAKTRSVEGLQVIRSGIRTFAKDENGNLLLNGRPIKLIGVNRHQDYPEISNALPNSVHHRDVYTLKSMGANFLRTSHYPQDPALYEACDELGILVWSEISVVNQIGLNEAFEINTLNNLRETIVQQYNHPSVVMWGFMNEVLLADHTFPKNERENLYNKTRELAQKLHNEAKLLDRSRLTTIAHDGNFDKYESAGLNSITDICGYNLYFGWYREGFESFERFVEQFKNKYPATPLIISEYGAGSNKGIYARQPRRFDNSMNWFELLHETYLHRILKNPRIAGGAAWVYADFSSEGRKDTDPNKNNKGLLYYNREPKDVFYLYKARLHKEPVVKIATGKWLKRPVEVPHGNTTWTDTVKIYSNCEQVTLTLNGRKAGTFRPDSMARIFAPVAFSEGPNQLVATGSGADGKTISDLVNLDFSFIPFPLNQSTFKQVCVNVGGHFDYVDTQSGDVWVADRPYRPGGWGYVGGEELTIWKGQRTGAERVIFNTLHDPIYQTQRVGINNYRFDVAPGWYEVELLFAELQSSREINEAFLNNLGNESKQETMKEGRIFSVRINNKLVMSKMNLMESVGESTAASFTFRIEANERGLIVEFDQIRSETVLNGIRIRKL